MARDSLPRSRTTGKPLTWERLRAALRYDPESGVFTRIAAYRNRGIGKVAGNITANGYIALSVDGCHDYGHRYAWFYMTGQWPPKGAEIDHRDGDPGNNKFSNLRLTDHFGNMQNGRFRRNNTSGFKGVSQSKWGWVATIMVRREAHYLGTFSTKEEAAAAYTKAATELHGEFARPK